MSKKLGWKSKSLIALAGLTLVGLIGGELFARFYLGLGDPPLSVADPQLEYYFKPGDYHRFGRRIYYNAYSMRSPEITPNKTDPREKRVLVLGDSVINGGSDTDQSETATALLQAELTKKTGSPVYVGNISAGSWGPPNEVAYLHKFGTFDADAIVLEVSGHDGADVPTFEPVVDVVPNMPGHKPISALWEGITRYLLPRLHPSAAMPDPSVPEGSKPLSDEQARRRESSAAIADMADLCRQRHIPFFIALYWGRYELKAPDPEQDVILNTAKEKGIRVVSLERPERDAIAAGRQMFRDDIHPNAQGQRVIADVLEPVLEDLLLHPTTMPAASP